MCISRVVYWVVMVSLLTVASRAFSMEGAFLATPTMGGDVSVRSWKALRDDRIVKQDLDYSCGAASLATILRGFYGVTVTEKEILDKMEQDGAASFEDLAQVARKYGFRAQGVALSFDKLKTLKVPAIAYLHHKGDDHFSVIRGIGPGGRIWLGDPSWGNRQFSAYQFQKMWETRDDDRFKGKLLLIAPRNIRETFMDETFFQVPESRLSLAKQLLLLRGAY